MKRPDEVTLIGIYHMVVGGLKILVGFVIAFFMAFAFNRTLGLIGLVLGVLAVACGIFSIIVGINVLKMKRWARIGSIVLAILGLPAFPVGTAIGVLILIYMMDNKKLFN